MSRKLLLILAVEIAILASYYLYICHKAGGFGFPLDDSWIHAHLARNIAEGRGIVYNPGQHVSTTAMLYTFLLAGAYKIALSPIFDAAALGLILHFASACVVYLITKKIANNDFYAALSAVAFAAVPRLMWGALSGMEVPLYVFLVTLGIYWHISYRWDDGWKAFLATFAFSLSALARPECAAFVMLGLFDRFISVLRTKRESGAPVKFALSIPIYLIIPALVLLPLLAFNYTSFGRPLPPAFYAKTYGLAGTTETAKLSTGLANARTCLGQMVSVCRRDNVILTIALLPGLIAVWRRYIKSPASGMLILPLGMIGVPALTGLLACIGTGKMQILFQTGRYSGYLVPLLAIIGVLGILEIKEAADRIKSGWLRSVRALAPVALIGAALIFISGNSEMARHFTEQVQNINDMQVALGKWAAKLPEGTVIAVNDAGAIPYFSRKKIIDTVGVVNPEVVPFLRRHKIRQIGLLEYLIQKKPDYVIIFPNWYRMLAARRDVLDPIKSIKLKHNVVCGGPEMVVYKPDWNAAKLNPEL